MFIFTYFYVYFTSSVCIKVVSCLYIFPKLHVPRRGSEKRESRTVTPSHAPGSRRGAGRAGGRCSGESWCGHCPSCARPGSRRGRSHSTRRAAAPCGPRSDPTCPAGETRKGQYEAIGYTVKSVWSDMVQYEQIWYSMKQYGTVWSQYEAIRYNGGVDKIVKGIERKIGKERSVDGTGKEDRKGNYGRKWKEYREKKWEYRKLQEK